ncbi:hypothetical protein HaLaN_13965 [Haematococcus lacustris]|uniref:Uncharacterized protein n=1 Tax=Haematococcus lacustris TaxID=44745 RepID=A0A699ZDF1_HAELA|nr:hypothetical protein HaLaN_13965 [Haematococcus lacustris]
MQLQPIYSIISCNVCCVWCNATMRTVFSYTGKLRPWLSVSDARHVGGAHHRCPANMAARASRWCRPLGEDVKKLETVCGSAVSLQWWAAQ